MRSNFDEGGVITEIMSKEDERLEGEEETERPPPAGQTEKQSIDQEDGKLIRTAKAQMGEVREENQRLKNLLTNIAKDYQSLQTHFFKIIKQDHHHEEEEEEEEEGGHPPPLTHQVKPEAHDLVSLSLGWSNSNDLFVATKKEEILKIDSNDSSGLSLAPDGKLEADLPVPVKSPGSQNSVGEKKEGDPTETKNNVRGADDNDVLQQSQMKKARVSVRVRCDAPTMHDGCQWRKYGQKIAKGNPCPRAYYRCTISPNCPVRKQVQRCVDDITILITTYEGTHNHPLPLSATAMASTTSAAASMLTSRSSTSQQQGGASSLSAPISASTTNALHFPQYTTIRPHHQFPYYLPTTSISNHNSHPTVTLDLTAPSNPNSSSHHFGNKFSQTSLNFSSPPPPHYPPSASWTNNYPTNYTSLGSKQPPIGQEHYYNQPSNSFMQLMNNSRTQKQPADFTAEAITAATKAIIASNPTIRNALAAAITSFAGNNGSSISTTTTSPGFGDHTSTGLNLKLGQSMAYSSSNGQNGAITCGPSYLNKPTPGFGSHQQVNLGLFPSSSPLAPSRSASESPPTSRDHVK